MEYVILQEKRHTAKRACEDWCEDKPEAKEARTECEQRLSGISSDLPAHISLVSDVLASIMLLLDDVRDYRSMRLTCRGWDAAYADNEWRFRDNQWTIIQEHVPKKIAKQGPRLQSLLEFLHELEKSRKFRFIYHHTGEFKCVAWENLVLGYRRIAHCIPNHWIVQTKEPNFPGESIRLYYVDYRCRRKILHCSIGNGADVFVRKTYGGTIFAITEYYSVNVKKLLTRESILTGIMSPEEFVEEVRLQITESTKPLDEETLGTLQMMMVDKLNLPLWLRHAAKKWYLEATGK